MKLPFEGSKELLVALTGNDTDAAYNALMGAIVRDCVSVLETKHNEFSKRAYPPPKILLELRDVILARYGLTKRSEKVIAPDLSPAHARPAK